MKRVLQSLILLVVCLAGPRSAADETDLLIIQHGDLPIIISASHGGALDLPDATARLGQGKATGPAGFRTTRDTGTEELALLAVKAIDEKMDGAPSCVISRVHRKYVDFNRPQEIGTEHAKAKEIYDLYHQTLRDTVNEIRQKHGHGLLIDIHGQGLSASTVYRGTSNGLTVQGLTKRKGTEALTGPASLTGLLRSSGWHVHPDPLDGKEQDGYTGGYIVRTYGSHRADGIECIQLEFGSDYRTKQNRERVAEELAQAIEEYSKAYLQIPQTAEPTQ